MYPWPRTWLKPRCAWPRVPKNNALRGVTFEKHSSLEAYLSQYCGPNCILTTLYPPVEGHEPRNYTGYFNPSPDLISALSLGSLRSIKNEAVAVLDRLKNKTKYTPHMPAYLIRSRIPRRIWDSYYKFCVERNPWDKMVSYYYWQKKLKEVGEEISFSEYIVNTNFRGDTYRYMSKNLDHLLVDRVLRYENLNEELEEVFTSLSIPYKGSLPFLAKHKARKKEGSYRDYYDKQLEDLVRERFHREIELLGFEF